MTDYKKGDIVLGNVTGIEKYGIFVRLDYMTSGLIHISEISDSFVRNPADFASIGEQIRVLIIEDVENHSSHVKLSIKNIDYQIYKKRHQKIVETPKGFSTLGDCLPKWIRSKEIELKEKLKKN